MPTFNKHYRVKYISKTNDLDVTFEHVPARNSTEAKRMTSRWLSAPDAWLAMEATCEETEYALNKKLALIRGAAEVDA